MYHSEEKALKMFGIESYVSQHVVFKGNVKTSPEDFKVTEITPEGKLASLTATKTDLSSRLGIKLSFKEQSEDINESTIDASQSNAQTGSSSIENNIHVFEAGQADSGKIDHRKCLESVVGDETFNVIENFASNELELMNESVPQPGTEKNILGQNPAFLNLGSVASKQSRTIIHKCVKHLHPHLRTKLYKLPDQEGSEVHISRDPTIHEFHDLDISLQTTLEFFKYVELRDREQTFSFEGLKSKDLRTKLHRLVAKHYGSFLETKTFGDGASDTEQQKIVVRFRQKFGDKRKRKERDGLDGQESKCQQVTGFTLQRTNTETLSAIQQLARLVGVHASDFTYAGIKDKKAVTTQEMAVKGVPIKMLQDAVSNKLPFWLRIGDMHSRKKPIVTGELWGNHFDITLRNVELKNRSSQEKSGTLDDDGIQLQNCIEQGIKCVEASGFINYFGEQRFGASSLDLSKARSTISPARIGCAMLQGKYKEAVDLILSPDDGPCADSSDATNIAKCCFLQTGSSREALKLMPAMKTRECLLLKALNRHGTEDEGYIKALMNIPHNMRQMYVHAFCSLIWNQMASWRIQHYGHQIVEGDLVCTDDLETKVHVVTQDEITNGKYSITEVMLPLPGNNIQYPSHAAGSEYHRRLDDAGLGECNFRMPALKLNIPGGYRKVIAQPRNLEWRWGVSRDKDSEDDGDQQTRETDGTPLPSNPAAKSSDALKSDCPDLMEASGRHVGGTCNGSDSNHAVNYHDSTHEISVVLPPGGSDCVSKFPMVSDSACMDDSFPVRSNNNELLVDNTKTTGVPNCAATSIQHHNDSCHSSLQIRDSLSDKSTQCYKRKSASMSSCHKQTLNLTFDLPSSCYATVFLKELMKS